MAAMSAIDDVWQPHVGGLGQLMADDGGEKDSDSNLSDCVVVWQVESRRSILQVSKRRVEKLGEMG